MKFEILSQFNKARAGQITFADGTIVSTPVFMPIGTYGSVKYLVPQQLEELGVTLLLSNTFHLLNRPGLDVIEHIGGLHRMMGWSKGILTDSGGFQIFSLGSERAICEAGVWLRSPVDGRKVFLTPERIVEAQQIIGSNIMMCLDVCAPADAAYPSVELAMERSIRWAERCRGAYCGTGQQALFGIVQGGVHEDLRARSLQAMRAMDFSGYALGGLSVGEAKVDMQRIIEQFAAELPESTPRYLMGVGTPSDLIHGVQHGLDMFDCVLPTRNARNGYLFTSHGIVRIRNSQYRYNLQPLDPNCSCYTCSNFNLSYLHHLARCREPLGCLLNSLHNVHFYQCLMNRLRAMIQSGSWDEVWIENLIQKSEIAA